MIQTHIQDKIGFITLDINKRNSLVPESIYSLIEFCKQMDASHQVNIIFLSSKNDKYFCNGLEPSAVVADAESCFKAIMDMIQNLYLLSKPMVACINGYAMAGGAVLGILADYRFISPKTKYSFSEVALGIPMTHLLVEIIKNVVGPFSC